MSWNQYQLEVAQFIADNLKKDVNEIVGSLEFPPNPKLGDYAFPCFTFAKVLKKSPQEIAKDLASKFKPTQLIKSATPAGGYINFSTIKVLDYAVYEI